MLTISCYIAMDSPEPAAKRVVLMKNMSDAFSRAALRDERAARAAFKDGGGAKFAARNKYIVKTECHTATRGPAVVVQPCSFGQKNCDTNTRGDKP